MVDIAAIEKHPHLPNERVYRIKTMFEGENPFASRWAYRYTSIRRSDVFGAIAEFANDEIEKINPYKIKYEYDTSLDPNDPPTPFNKDEFLKSMQALSELSQRAAGEGGDTGLVVTLPKGAPTRTVAPEEAAAASKEVSKLIEDIGQRIVEDADANRKAKGLE